MDALRGNVWFSVHRKTGDLAAYRRDLRTAWDAARRQSGSARCALQLRYALMTCSVNSQAASTPPALWSILVQQGELSGEEALTQARQIPAAERRAEALTDLIEVVPDGMRDEVRREALAAVRAVPDGYWRVGELWRLHPHIDGDLRSELLAIVESMADPYYRVVAYRLLGIEDPVATVSLRLDSEHEALDSPTGLAGSAAFVESYLRRWQFVASQLKRAGLAAVGQSNGVIDDPLERYWRAQLLVVAAVDASGDSARAMATEAVRVGEAIGDRREIAVAWRTLGAHLAASVRREVPRVVSKLSSPMARAVFLLQADRLDSPEAECERLTVEALGDVTTEQEIETVVLEAGTALLRRGFQQLSGLVDRIADAAIRAELLLTVAAHAPAGDAEQIAAHVLTMVRSDPGLARRSDLLARLVALLPAASLSAARHVADAHPDLDARSSLLAALGVRWCELGSLNQASAILRDVTGLSKAFLVRSLAESHARVGDPRLAVTLANDLPYASWRAEALALAACRLDPDAAASAMTTAAAIAKPLELSSKISVLARTAVAAPAALQPELFAAARDGAQAIDDPSERSLALLAVTDMLLSRHDVSAALSAATQIPMERIGSKALVGVLAEADQAVARQISERIGSIADPEVRVQLRVATLGAALRGVGAEQGAGPRNALLQSFDQALSEFAARPRGELLANFPLLVSAAELLDGPQAVPSIAADLADIVEWWP